MSLESRLTVLERLAKPQVDCPLVVLVEKGECLVEACRRLGLEDYAGVVFAATLSDLAVG